MSSSSKGSLVGSIVERKSAASPASPPAPQPNAKHGFPSVQHRSKSAFQRAREEKGRFGGSERPSKPPVVTAPHAVKKPRADEDDEEPRSSRIIAEATENWRRQMEEENLRKVEAMTDEEREAERREILERFGPNVGEILRKARAAREAALAEGSSPNGRSSRPRADSKVLKSALASRAASPSPASPDGSQTPTRADRHLRFADVTREDVHVYESAPPSPKRKPLALMSPTEADGPVVSLGQFQGKLANYSPEDSSPTASPMAVDSPTAPGQSAMVVDASSTPSAPSERIQGGDLEEGTPEDIRRRFFPNAAPHEPSLAWMEDTSAEPDASSSTTLRFDLAGKLISPDDAEKLPTHLGLHHHAEGKHAGYTLDDIFLLSRSTVPAQRASMLDVLSKIGRQLSNVARQQGDNIKELVAREADLRKRMLGAGLEAISERGTVGIRAVELVWVCAAYWDSDDDDMEGIELKSTTDDVLSPLPMEYVMTQIADALTVAALPSESLLQLLDILLRLARHSNDIATSIVNTPKPLASLSQRFVFVSSSSEASHLPQPKALHLLNVLAQSSRQNASAVADSAEALLRFVVTLPPSSIYPEPLATTLLAMTLGLYVTLASYGLCAHIASTASEPLHALSHYVLSDGCQSDALREAYLLLVEAWTICARDPHKTTPDHDILWSQVTGWGWGEDILKLRGALPLDRPKVWAALWRAESAWLEGTAINAPKAGEGEKAAALHELRPDFECGKAHTVIETTMKKLESALTSFSPEDISRKDAWRRLSEPADVLAAALRLWLACLPFQNPAALESPPFPLPFVDISMFCARLTLHPLWIAVRNGTVPALLMPFVRSLSLLLAVYLDFSRFLPGASDDLWLAQAFAIVLRLVPGDEEYAVRSLERALSRVTASFMEVRGWPVPPIIWEKHGTEPIAPFITFSLEHKSSRIAPLWPSPSSISTCATLQLPAPSSDTSSKPGPLPLNRDWMFAPLDHLLRSGQSDVFKTLPTSWDFSETEVARATFLVAQVHREVLSLHGLGMFTLNREETIFSSVKVFMLEHGQQQETSAEEVFRDTVLGKFMEKLLVPFTFASAASLPTPSNAPTLEEVSKTFLGAGTPFYQYYTDFVALFDAISFGHSLFSSLLLPPLSMRYPSDYRKYLWADYSQVVRSIKTPLEAALSQDLREFLWPVETNPEVVSAYLRALVKQQTQGPFTHLVAVHHVACNIWPDLGEVPSGEKAVKLLQAVVMQAGPEVIKDVVSYRQYKEKLVLPPTCFQALDEVKEARRLFISTCSPAVKDRLTPLLE